MMSYLKPLSIMLLINNQKVYRVVNGQLEEVGDAVQMRQIRGWVYQVGENVYILNGMLLNLLAVEARAYQIVKTGESLPRALLEMKNYQKKSDSEPDPELWEKYLKMKARDTVAASDEILKKGVVITSSESLKMYIDGQGFVSGEEMKMLGESRHAFFYHGAVYAYDRDIWFGKIPFEPLFKGQNYLIFWGGGEMLFALVKKGDDIRIEKIGRLERVVETKVSKLMLIDEGNDKYSLYHLGEDISPIDTFEGFQSYYVHQKNGAVVIYKDGGEADYTFTNGGYQRLL